MGCLVIMSLLKPFGLLVEASGDECDVSRMHSDKLRELVIRHRLVIFRGFNEMEEESLVRFSQGIGKLLEWEFGNVMEMRVQDVPKNYLFTSGVVPFHWDGAFHQTPRYLIFHCLEAPDMDAGGETLFTDTSLIWNAAAVAEKKAWSSYQLVCETEKLAHYGGKIRVPLVQEHIDSRQNILRFAEPVLPPMLNPVRVSIEGAPTTFMRDMAQRCYQEKYCYKHTWETNDLIIADNYALLHARYAFNKFTKRHLRRIQVL